MVIKICKGDVMDRRVFMEEGSLNKGLEKVEKNSGVKVWGYSIKGLYSYCNGLEMVESIIIRN